MTTDIIGLDEWARFVKESKTSRLKRNWQMNKAVRRKRAIKRRQIDERAEEYSKQIRRLIVANDMKGLYELEYKTDGGMLFLNSNLTMAALRVDNE